ncbi:MarR family winged helix-turn-helix transcriptional regulator [Chryseobacterium sp. MEBOG07]|uniref:MarR family winged helix-turn-helix transcriptional regulator n=1 Tax=Chryseobacterium sp. MEBOG07 TaxID=2879939 RepID=UPI001F3D1CDD|nr:MarR family winged helix-turn-helix transcriptional regulator [Chryseobacterium sp. MEBOG07]UKB81047.1 MarR family winged helix-turn-helix transcriptional regulator [Chryseobacterium sp. MEBOG07]
MNYDLIKSVVELVQQFMERNEGKANYNDDLHGFIEWINASQAEVSGSEESDWIGKEMGRSPDSIINTLLVRMSRYAKSYSRSAIHNSAFSSQDDFIYLISLKSTGPMSKMELIRHNVHEKPAGILIINRLIHNGWVEQTVSEKDKRTKHIQITKKGLDILDKHMDKIRKASRIVIGDLTHSEQMLLIAILTKLDDFHHSVYHMNLEATHLLDNAYKKLN